jgi:hypothetical protein
VRTMKDPATQERWNDEPASRVDEAGFHGKLERQRVGAGRRKSGHYRVLTEITCLTD